MDRIQDTHSYTNALVQGEVLACRQIDDDHYDVTYSLPASNFDVGLGGITNLWPVVAGEVYNFHFIKSASLVGLELPEAFRRHYLGPRYGIEGVRSLVGVSKGPLFGSIIKPNIGLGPEQSAGVVGILAEAGFNFIKDDEICVSPATCTLEQRAKAVSRELDGIRQRTGRSVLYAANVTSDFSVLGKAAEAALRSGAGALMIDPLCTGLSAIDFLRRNFDAPIYAHRVGYGLFCLSPKLNISFSVLTGLFRMLGIDFSHVGGIWGKSEASRKNTAGYLDTLRGESGKKRAWPVVTGISVENMSDYYGFYGDDTLFMDHIDIYRNVEQSRAKLDSLKERLAAH
jgi:ribulose-bisphosphate carboxylase large chain